MSNELPLGFAMALSQNIDAMDFYSNLSEKEQANVLNQIQNINSQKEMHKFVQNLKNNF